MGGSGVGDVDLSGAEDPRIDWHGHWICARPLRKIWPLKIGLIQIFFPIKNTDLINGCAILATELCARTYGAQGECIHRYFFKQGEPY